MNNNQPSEWSKVILGDMCRIEIGGTPARNTPEYWAADGAGHPWVSISDLDSKWIADTQERITDLGISRSNVKLVEPNTLLMSFKLTIGRVAFAAITLYTNEAIAAFYPDDQQLESRWLYHALPDIANSGNIDQAVKGATLNKSKLNNLQFSLPSLEEQQLIADILDTIDAAIQHTQAVIDKLKEVRAGLLHDLLTYGIDANGDLRDPVRHPEQFKQSALGLIPRAWEVLPFAEVADLDRGKFTHRPRNDPDYYGGIHPFIQTGDIAEADGEYIETYSQTLSDLGVTVSKQFPAGTIAITIAANIADTAILSVPMFFPDSVVGVQVYPENSIRFVELCVRRAKPSLNAIAPQSAQKNINLQFLRPLLLPVPSTEEQQLIADVYESNERRIRTERETHDKLLVLKNGLSNDLLTGTVRVTQLIDSHK